LQINLTHILDNL